jgi:hypothetical protein
VLSIICWLVLFVLGGLYCTERFFSTSAHRYAVGAFICFLLGSFSHEWGLFGIAAALLLWLLLHPLSGFVSKKTGLLLLPAALVLLLYLVNQWLSGSMIAHYGADVHLHFQWREMVAMFYKYCCKILLLSGFWPVEMQEKLFAYFLQPTVNTLLLLVLLLIIARSFYHLLFRKTNASAGWFLLLLYVLFVFPVLNLYFPNWTKIMADRYCYLTSAFLISAMVVCIIFCERLQVVIVAVCCRHVIWFANGFSLLALSRQDNYCSRRGLPLEKQ